LTPGGADDPGAARRGPVARPKLLIDCDPGHDDALAIIVAARHADIVGITTVAGNAPLDLVTRNALRVAELAGLDHVPVHAGAARPLRAPARHAAGIHGPTGLDGPPPVAPVRRLDGDAAAGFIVETVRALAPGEVWLVPTGPMTNVALAFEQAPDLVERLAGMSFMGGAAGPGNVTPTAEFNVWADPEAAAAAIAAAVPRTFMAGLDVTRQCCVDDAFLLRLEPLAAAGRVAATFCHALVAFYLDRQAEATGRRLGPVHDVCAVLAVTHPDLLRFARHPVAVELHGELTRGMTVVDRRPRPAEGFGPAVAVGTAIDGAAALDVVFEAIAALP
jgi:inosine-uridine nucleoside N-ribohydrolase